MYKKSRNHLLAHNGDNDDNYGDDNDNDDNMVLMTKYPSHATDWA